MNFKKLTLSKEAITALNAGAANHVVGGASDFSVCSCITQDLNTMCGLCPTGRLQCFTSGCA